MALIAIDGAACSHTGSTIVGPVRGTTIADSGDSFFTINGSTVVSSSAIMKIPNHYYAPLLLHSHEYTPETHPQGFVFMNDKLVAVVGSSHAGDQTTITDSGGQGFVTIEPSS